MTNSKPGEVPKLVELFVAQLQLNISSSGMCYTPRAQLWRTYKRFCIGMGARPSHGPADFYQYFMRCVKDKHPDAELELVVRQGYDCIAGVYVNSISWS